MCRESERDRLIEACARAGHPLVMLDLPEGGQVAVLPHGGRVIGLWPDGGANRLWTHPELAAPDRAARLLHGAEWPNSGGDRCWLAPEVDLFFPPDRPGDPAVYRVPSALDPGAYRVERQADGLVMSQTVRLTAAGVPVTAMMSRRCAPCPDPLPGRDLVFAGYSLTSSLRLTGPKPVRLGLWQLLQLNAPGTMLLATVGTAQVYQVFGDFLPNEMQADPGRLSWSMERGPTRKIAILATQTGSRSGHLHQDPDGRWHLAVREFTVDPAGEYRDALWRDPSRRGFAFQACLVDEPRFGRFDEIEHHSPAASANGAEVRDQCSVLTWSGAAETVRPLVDVLFPSPSPWKGPPCAAAQAT